ncbi:N5-glutamine methyltransferase family protein [Pseudomonas vanderleydeniana]|uniref:Peptide chain release factor N(5)-glutamine methyltransferase n=1 Tax=Pseudomonas vanderleydeniana TaxID=2745495 RepID=A0A9E6PHU5_9PSED|nr:HemK/PrmC family methyltransferase [Pseudomonas vanderleydeniana]QXI26841.1 peptide chain release factor N(5)-glutamine methyltransferase [Pseudomonas vanderleydeniana]
MIHPPIEHEQATALDSLTRAGVWDPAGDLKAIAGKHFPPGAEPDRQRLSMFRLDVAERCARTPLGHILGYADFADLRFVLGSGVFIPRLQSMAIVRWIEQNLALDSRSTVYDLCSGVGAIGLALGTRTGASVVCVENDALAQAYLRRNIHRLCPGRHDVILYESDITRLDRFEQARCSVDVVVSNPPYVPAGTELLPEWGVHHPSEAIYANDQGIGLIEASARLASFILKPDGTVLIEHGEAQGDKVRSMLGRHGFGSIRTFVDGRFGDSTGPAVVTVGSKL